jgi:hypothetical protein
MNIFTTRPFLVHISSFNEISFLSHRRRCHLGLRSSSSPIEIVALAAAAASRAQVSVKPSDEEV